MTIGEIEMKWPPTAHLGMKNPAYQAAYQDGFAAASRTGKYEAKDHTGSPYAADSPEDELWHEGFTDGDAILDL